MKARFLSLLCLTLLFGACATSKNTIPGAALRLEETNFQSIWVLKPGESYQVGEVFSFSKNKRGYSFTNHTKTALVLQIRKGHQLIRKVIVMPKSAQLVSVPKDDYLVEFLESNGSKIGTLVLCRFSKNFVSAFAR